LVEEEEVFHSAAKAWIDCEAAEIDREASELESRSIHLYLPRLEKRVRALRHRKRRVVLLASAAAAAVLALLAVWLIPAVRKASETEIVYMNPNEAPPQEILELNFVLPEGTEVVSTELKNGKTVHTLSDSRYGEIIVTMELPGPDNPDFSKMERLLIDGTQVPANIGAQTKMIAFEHGGIVYTVTTQGETAALFSIYRAITAAG